MSTVPFSPARASPFFSLQLSHRRIHVAAASIDKSLIRTKPLLLQTFSVPGRFLHHTSSSSSSSDRSSRLFIRAVSGEDSSSYDSYDFAVSDEAVDSDIEFETPLHPIESSSGKENAGASKSVGWNENEEGKKESEEDIALALQELETKALKVDAALDALASLKCTSELTVRPLDEFISAAEEALIPGSILEELKMEVKGLKSKLALLKLPEDFVLDAESTEVAISKTVKVESALNVFAALYKFKEFLDISALEAVISAAAPKPVPAWEDPRRLGSGAEGAAEAAAAAALFAQRENLKQTLIDTFYGTSRGLRASGETRGEISELISQLEALSPTPAPTESGDLLDGKWILAYTSFSEIFTLLAADFLPFVSVGEISQTIDASSNGVVNEVTFNGPMTSSTVAVNATYEVRSAKRLQVRFEQGVLGAPQVRSSLALPSSLPPSLDLFGQSIDLSALQPALQPLSDLSLSLSRLLSGQPSLKFPINSSSAQSWLLTSFLDKDLRISRGDGGSVFVLVKEGSALQELL